MSQGGQATALAVQQDQRTIDAHVIIGGQTRTATANVTYDAGVPVSMTHPITGRTHGVVVTGDNYIANLVEARKAQPELHGPVDTIYVTGEDHARLQPIYPSNQALWDAGIPESQFQYH